VVVRAAHEAQVSESRPGAPGLVEVEWKFGGSSGELRAAIEKRPAIGG